MRNVKLWVPSGGGTRPASAPMASSMRYRDGRPHGLRHRFDGLEKRLESPYRKRERKAVQALDSGA